MHHLVLVFRASETPKPLTPISPCSWQAARAATPAALLQVEAVVEGLGFRIWRLGVGILELEA